MIQIFDQKFRFLTHKIINFLSKSMVLIFFCILISTSAKIIAKNLINKVESLSSKVTLVYEESPLFDLKNFNTKNNDKWLKVKKLKNNQQNEIQFDVLLTFDAARIDAYSNANSLAVLDADFLATLLKDGECKVELSKFKDFAIVRINENQSAYICINKSAKYIKLNHATVAAIVSFFVNK
jgi:hypothetical protein